MVNKVLQELFSNFFKVGVIIVYIMIMTIGFYGEEGGLPWNTPYIMWFGIVCLSVLVLFITAQMDNLKMILSWIILFSISYLIMVLASMISWIVNFQSISYMVKSAQKVFYQIVGVLGAGAAIYLFGFKAVYYTFYGMVAANTLILLQVIQKFGLGTLLSGIVQLLITGGEVDIDVMRALEIHDLTFAFGFFFMFFVIRHKDIKYAWIHIFLALFFWFIGFKRISILGIVIGFLLYFLLNFLKPAASLLVIRWSCVLLCVACFAYIWSVRYGMFDQIVDMVGINTMGRTNLYHHFEKYYSLSPGFLGHGMSFVAQTVNEWFQSGVLTHNFGGLHNDVLTIYIETGFLGYLFWLFYEVIFKTWHYMSVFGKKAGMLFFSMMISLWITYFTDNTFLYGYTNIAFRIIVLAIAVKVQKSGKEDEDGTKDIC